MVARPQMDDKIIDASNEDAEAILERILYRKAYGYEVRDNLAAALRKIVRESGGKYRTKKGIKK